MSGEGPPTPPAGESAMLAQILSQGFSSQLPGVTPIHAPNLVYAALQRGRLVEETSTSVAPMPALPNGDMWALSRLMNMNTGTVPNTLPQSMPPVDPFVVQPAAVPRLQSGNDMHSMLSDAMFGNSTSMMQSSTSRSMADMFGSMQSQMGVMGQGGSQRKSIPDPNAISQLQALRMQQLQTIQQLIELEQMKLFSQMQQEQQMNASAASTSYPSAVPTRLSSPQALMEEKPQFTAAYTSQLELPSYQQLPTAPALPSNSNSASAISSNNILHVAPQATTASSLPIPTSSVSPATNATTDSVATNSTPLHSTPLQESTLPGISPSGNPIVNERASHTSSNPSQSESSNSSNKKATPSQPQSQSFPTRGRTSRTSLGTEAKSEIRQQKRERSTAATTTTRVKKQKLQDLEKTVKEMGSKCMNVEEQCRVLEIENAQLRGKLHGEFRARLGGGYVGAGHGIMPPH